MTLLIRTDVTAVKLYQNFILAGIGSSVCIYRKDTLKLLATKTCLRGQKIYGFVPSEDSNKILVFGGKQYTVLYFESLKEEFADGITLRLLFAPVICDDWLHSAVWSGDGSVILLTAHNTVQYWDITKQVMVTQKKSKENSILYSGLLLPLQDNVLVFAGTVYSEVIIHTPLEDEALHYLKGHRGVIFSIACCSNIGIIVTTSDDRSVRIWGINADCSSGFSADTVDYWKAVNIKCLHEVYGHTARVMRSCITSAFIVSVGEDSTICFWDHKGENLRKILTHQNGCIWSVDSDNDHLLTGGGDCGVMLHPLSMVFEYGVNETLNFDTTPKKVVFTARKNLVVLDDSGNLIHYDVCDKSKTVHMLNHESTYKLLSLSSCKQLIAVSDMTGKLDVFIESCKDKPCIVKIVDIKLNLGKVLSVHWASNRHLVLCVDNGVITVVCSSNDKIEVDEEFVLPPCKERWLTAVAIDPSNKALVVGDRCGNIHIFVKSNKNPIKTFTKVHGRYGPTSITVRNDEFISTGRDGSIKFFSLNPNEKYFAKCMSHRDVEFQWVEKFIDKNEHIICGFQERIFVVSDIKNNLKLLEVNCGGGHRSWDVIRYIDRASDVFDEFIRMAYVKNSDIHLHTFQMSKISSRNVVVGSHSKEIYCLQIYKSRLDESLTFYITGGADTTLRVSSVDSDARFRDEVVFKQLSNIRALKTFQDRDTLMIVSAGGRAQICIKIVNFSLLDKNFKISTEQLVDYMIKGTDKSRKNNQTWRNSTVDFDPETRIMDVALYKMANDQFVIYAGCSDACLRIFNLKLQPTGFEMVDEVRYHKTCILKTVCVEFLNKNILITCTTRGEIALWDFSNQKSGTDRQPFLIANTNKSGINCIDTRLIDDKLLIATGGDDNAVHLILLESDKQNMKIKYRWSTDQYHCSQVTGLRFVGDFLLSASIDQRVTLSKWFMDEGVKCEFVAQAYSDVADIQGMEVLSSDSGTIKVCVFGKGMEVLAMTGTGAGGR